MISSGRDACMSILLSTGTIARLLLTARIGIGDGLGLHPLGGVDQENRSFAGRQAARDFVVEVDVSGRVDQVELIDLAIERVVDRDRPGLDRDSALALEIHVVEQLLAKLALGDGPRLQAGVGRPACSYRDRYGRRSRNFG